jgi:hypothetical protein
VVVVSFSLGSVPVPYAGKVSIDGQNYHGQLNFTFAIYTASNDLVWDSGSSAIEVPVTNGRYLVLLGGQGMRPLPASLFHANDELYVGVYADLPNDNVGQVKLGELQRITAQPYALVAEMAKLADAANISTTAETANVADFAKSADAVRAGAITKQMLGQDVLSDLNRTITSNEIADHTITTNQLNEQILKYLKPEIQYSPKSTFLIKDENRSLRLNAEGKFLQYQWVKNNVQMIGEELSELKIRKASRAEHEGNYSVRVSNDFGEIISNPFEVTVSDSTFWDKSYGGTKNDRASTIIETIDGAFLLAGTSESTANGNKNSSGFGLGDFWVIKASPDGRIIWDQNYGGSGNDGMVEVLKYENDGFLLLGNSDSEISGNKSLSSRGGVDFWVVGIKEDGSVIWDQAFGGALDDSLSGAVHNPSDNSYILVGTSDSNRSFEKSTDVIGGTDIWVLKIDAFGNKIWDKTFGGEEDEGAFAVINAGNGNFLIGGYSLSGISGDKTEESRGRSDFWFLKIDEDGNKIWDKRFGSNHDDECWSLIKTNDNCFLAGGFSRGVGGDRSQSSLANRDLWIVKFDQLGNKIWDKRFGGNSNEYCRHIIETSDNCFLLIGNSDSYNFSDSSGVNPDYNDAWIIKIDGTGNALWDRLYGGNNQFDVATSGIKFRTGGFLILGHSNSSANGNKTAPSFGNPHGSYDIWLIKTREDGTK